MARILVIAHLNHDRIWELTGPLKSGSRVSWGKRETRLGGGGYFTGSPFLALGHKVALVSSLGNDALGETARLELSALGFDMQHVLTRDRGTHITEILLEPSGERTILTPSDGPMRLFRLDGEVDADAAYINCFNPDATIQKALDSTGFVASQFPLSDTSVPRPADLMIGSKGDFPELDDDALWRKALHFCGARLKHLVMTDGTRSITIYDGKQERIVSPTKRAVVKSTIGAGDHFSANLVSALLDGMAIESAASFASKATADWLELRDREPTL
ncbi:pfkB carbohydrate kinase family protein [Ochrobactrum quorumnocens]|uniref:PfkB carbohydrate kinase family protein n=1 Tax=Ochrobactrum quorumnocens TaxID=271865 RepID=A0A248UCJ5_9HYPH|nr:PfkB family carbohydrate kinase [[Ochrobactrum] quorumnocens]ASV84386.1 pfkB carbohydrate kinase family protein [[Ochrobactrum] quorumnocens]